MLELDKDLEVEIKGAYVYVTYRGVIYVTTKGVFKTMLEYLTTKMTTLDCYLLTGKI